MQRLCEQRSGSVATVFYALHDLSSSTNYDTRLRVSVSTSRFPSKEDSDTTQATIESVPTALLTRARDISLEHRTLTEKLANGFEARVAKKVGEYGPVVTALGQWDKANEVSARQPHWQAR